jgi:phospholipid transport system substrate-binding protein
MKLFVALTLAIALQGVPEPGFSEQTPEALVRDTSDRMVAALKSEHATIEQHPERLYELVSDIVLPHFDFDRMGQWALGKYWRTASAQQRKRFVEEFKTLLVRTYGSALFEYTDQKIVYQPVRMKEDDKEVTVSTEVEQKGAFPIPIDYDLYRTSRGWKVYDVSLDQLIKELAAQNKQIAG